MARFSITVQLVLFVVAIALTIIIEISSPSASLYLIRLAKGAIFAIIALLYIISFIKPSLQRGSRQDEKENEIAANSPDHP